MRISELRTPTVLVDLERLRKNIYTAAYTAKSNNKHLWPMFKTTKSTFIAKLQRDAGSNGFLSSNVYEASALVNKGITKNVMIAYPIVSKEEIKALINLIERGTKVIVRIDNLRMAETISRELRSNAATVEYCIKIDVGYGRLGIKPENAGIFVTKLRKFRNLVFAGIVTHQGNAYRAKNPTEVEEIAKYSAKQMETAVSNLKKYDIEPEIIGAGSTPTFRFDVAEGIYTHLFPGNYVYFDRTQALAYGSASIKDCALTLLATVISKPQHSGNKLAIIDAGTKYIEPSNRGGLVGYGQLVNNPRAIVTRVSQEIAVLRAEEDGIDIGEKVRVITNHSCYTNNSVNLLVGHTGSKVTGIIPVDAKKEDIIEKVLRESYIKILH